MNAAFNIFISAVGFLVFNLHTNVRFSCRQFQKYLSRSFDTEILGKSTIYLCILHAHQEISLISAACSYQQGST